MTNKSLPTLLCAAMVAAHASLAQAQERLLKPSEVTEQALIDALFTGQPAHPDCKDAAPGTCRGFGAMAPARQPRPNAGKANLLIIFPTDSADLTAEAKATLDVVARAIQSDALVGESFRIEGHADPRVTDDHNMRLSQACAEAVSHYLVAERAVLPERLNALGKGSSEPINLAQRDAPENRRVTVVAVPN